MRISEAEKRDIDIANEAIARARKTKADLEDRLRTLETELGIKFENRARNALLTNNILTVKKGRSLGLEQLMQLVGVGPRTGEVIYNAFHQDKPVSGTTRTDYSRIKVPSR